MRCALLALGLILLLAPVARAADETPADAASDPWRQLPSPESEARITGLAVDRDGTLWIMTGGRPDPSLFWSNGEPRYIPYDSEGDEISPGRLYWYDGTQWREPENADEIAGTLARGLFGGRDRPLIAAARDGVRGPIVLYELHGGKATRLAEHDLEMGPLPEEDTVGLIRHSDLLPRAWISRAGQVFCYCDFQIHVLVDGAWKAVTPGPVDSITFMERDGEVLIHYANLAATLSEGREPKVTRRYRSALCTVSPAGEAAERALGEVERTYSVVATPWGENCLLVAPMRSRVTSDLEAYDIDTLKPVDLADVRDTFRGYGVLDAFRTPDGSVWLYRCKMQGRSVIDASFRILTPEGDLFASGDELDETAMAWDRWRSQDAPQSVLITSDGTLWLGTAGDTVTRCKDGVVHSYKLGRQMDCLAEAPDGTVYAASRSSVYVLARHGETQ